MLSVKAREAQWTSETQPSPTDNGLRTIDKSMKRFITFTAVYLATATVAFMVVSIVTSLMTPLGPWEAMRHSNVVLIFLSSVSPAAYLFNASVKRQHQREHQKKIAPD